MIKPAVVGTRLGFTCERSKPRTGNLIRDILNELNRADVVIADLTDMNPNVFYELGVRHTLRNRTILIAQDMRYVPSDLRSYWVIIYKKGLSGLQDFKDKIRRTMREMMNDPEQPDNPVADFLGEKNVSLVSQERVANLRKLTALLGELSYNLDAADAILDTVEKSTASRKGKKSGSVSPVRFGNACLSLLLSTRYIELPEEDLKRLEYLNSGMLALNVKADLCQNEAYATSAEKSLGELLPEVKNRVVSLLKRLDQVRVDYMNNNYQEETMPVLFLHSDEHKQYIKSA
jgi:nucleoside 2-deoxyribosyltransferase